MELYMSNVYKFSPENEDDFIIPTDPEDTNLLLSSVLSVQNPIPCEKIVQVELKGSQKFVNNSFLWLHPNCIVCDSIAYEKIRGFISGCGAWSKLILKDEPLYIFTVTKEIDALNEDDSEFVEMNGFKLDVKRYSFNSFNECESPIFLLSNMKGHYPLMSGYFVEKIKELNISGLKYRLL